MKSYCKYKKDRTARKKDTELNCNYKNDLLESNDRPILYRTLLGKKVTTSVVVREEIRSVTFRQSGGAMKHMSIVSAFTH